MDLREYLALEAGLGRRLHKVWGPLARKTYVQATDLIKKDQFTDAYKLAESLNLKVIGDKNRKYIKFMLRQSAVFGARMINADPVMTIGNYDTFLDHVTENFVRTVENNVTDHVQSKLLQLIAEAENPTVQKADTKRFVREFVSFKKEGDEKLQLISSLHTSRLTTWGFTGEAQVSGVTKYKLLAVLDGRTSKFCQIINGHEFLVEDARKTIVTVLQADDPEDVRTLQPWPKQDKASLDVYRELSTEALVARNLHVPPFHPGCRTLCMKVGTILPVAVTNVTETPFKPVTLSRATELSIDGKLTNPLPDDSMVKGSFNLYATGAHQRINGYMRTNGAYQFGANSPESKEDILQAISLIGSRLDDAESVLRHDLRLYRGIEPTVIMKIAGLEDEFFNEIDPFRLVGTVFEEPGFMSFSYNKGIADGFGDMVLSIEARKGETGWQDMREISGLEEEAEVLRKGGRFRIKDYDVSRGTFVVEPVYE